MIVRSVPLTALLYASALLTSCTLVGPAIGQASKAGAPLPPAGQKSALPPASVQRATTIWQSAIDFQKAKKYPQAISAYTEFLKFTKQAGLPAVAGRAAYQNMAAIYRGQGRPDELIASLKSWADLAPDDPAPHSELSTLYASPKLRRFDDAEKEARKTLALKPNAQFAAAAHSTLGLVAISAKDFAAAEQEFGASAKLVPNNAQMVYNYGLALVERKKYAPAIAAMQKVTALNPKLTGAWYYMGVLNETQRKYPDAVKALEQAQKLAPADPLIRMELGRSLAYANNIDGAIASYVSAIALLPQNVQARIAVSQLYLQSQNYPAARAQLVEVVRLSPKDADALDMLASCEAQLSFQPQDLAARAKLLNQAEEHYRAAAEINPAFLVGPNSLARFYERTNNIAKAQAIYRKRMATDPNDLANYNALANTFIMERKSDEAIAIWREYQKLNPGDASSYMNVAGTLEAQSRWPDAIDEWRRLLAQKLPPGAIAGAHVAIGKDLARANMPAEATAELEAVLKLDQAAPDAPKESRVANVATIRAERLEAMQQLAEISDHANKLDEAIRWQQQIKAEEAATAERTNGAPNAATYIKLAQLYQRAKKPDLAIKELDALTQTRQLHKDAFAPAFEQLAEVYDSEKRYDEAAAAYRRSAIYAKEPLSDRLHAAEVYQRGGMLPKAITEFEAVLKDYPKEGRVLTPLAMAYRQAGRDEDAIRMYDSLLKVDPRATWARDLKASVLTHMRRFDDARALYEEQLAANPQNRQLYADIAFVYQSEGRADAFLDWIKPRFEKNPANGTLMAVLVDEAIRQKKDDVAWTMLRDAASKHKTDRILLESAAGLLVQHNRGEEALPLYREVAAQHPKDLPAQVQLADHIYAAGHKDEATKLYSSLISRTDLSQAEKLTVRRQFAQCCVDQGNPADAITQLQAVVHDDPNDFDSASRLASLLEAANRPTEAIPVLQGLSTQQVYPAAVRAQIVDRIGALFVKSGDKTNAESAYRKALQLNPKDATALAGLAGLGKQ